MPTEVVITERDHRDDGKLWYKVRMTWEGGRTSGFEWFPANELIELDNKTRAAGNDEPLVEQAMKSCDDIYSARRTGRLPFTPSTSPSNGQHAGSAPVAARAVRAAEDDADVPAEASTAPAAAKAKATNAKVQRRKYTNLQAAALAVKAAKKTGVATGKDAAVFCVGDRVIWASDAPHPARFGVSGASSTGSKVTTGKGKAIPPPVGKVLDINKKVHADDAAMSGLLVEWRKDDRSVLTSIDPKQHFELWETPSPKK